MASCRSWGLGPEVVDGFLAIPQSQILLATPTRARSLDEGRVAVVIFGEHDKNWF